MKKMTILTRFRRSMRGAFVGLGVTALFCSHASASVFVAELSQISFPVPGFITSVGTVTVVDHLGYAEVQVSLNNGATFINTGGPHTPFVYNLDTPTLATEITPLPYDG